MVANNLEKYITPFEDKYIEEAAPSASARSQISLEERAKRHIRKNRNRSEKQSRKIHQKKRKTAKINKKMKKLQAEIDEATCNRVEQVREKFP